MRNQRNNNNRAGTSYFDYSLLFIIIFLLGFGLVMLYSTSAYTSQLKFGSSTYYLYKQIFSSALGLVGLAMVSMLDYHLCQKFAVLIYLASLGIVFLVKSPLGIELNGASRWVAIGPLSFQPAEFVKVGVIIFFAFVLEKNIRKIKNVGTAAYILLFAFVPAAEIFIITDNLSSAVIILGIGFVMEFVASPNYKEYILAIALGMLCVLGIIYYIKNADLSSMDSFRADRIIAWLDPEKASSDIGFQVVQGLYAIGSGGLFGKGLGKSIQKLGFVPEAQNDMIYTIICEELGVIGGIAVILLFVFMIWRFMIIANNASDLFGSMLVVGIMAHISIQVIFNIAVVTGVFPNTGVTLPFISYGGTSILFLLGEMGLALSVSKRIRFE